MNVELNKQPQKYLASVDTAVSRKLYKGIEDIKTLSGNIMPLKGHKNKYRYKIAHYRIVFSFEKGDNTIIITEINTRTNIKY